MLQAERFSRTCLTTYCVSSALTNATDFLTRNKILFDRSWKIWQTANERKDQIPGRSGFGGANCGARRILSRLGLEEKEQDIAWWWNERWLTFVWKEPDVRWTSLLNGYSPDENLSSSFLFCCTVPDNPFALPGWKCCHSRRTTVWFSERDDDEDGRTWAKLGSVRSIGLVKSYGCAFSGW